MSQEELPCGHVPSGDMGAHALPECDLLLAEEETEALGQEQRGCLRPQGSPEQAEQEPQGLGEVGGAPRQGAGQRNPEAGCESRQGGRQLPRGFRESGGRPLSWLPSAGLGGVEAEHKAGREGPNPETQTLCGALSRQDRRESPGYWSAGRGGGGESGNVEGSLEVRTEPAWWRAGGLRGWPGPTSLACDCQVQGQRLRQG